MPLTAWTVISSTIDFLADMKSRNAAAKGKSVEMENDMSFQYLMQSVMSHAWNPIDSSPAITHTLA